MYSEANNVSPSIWIIVDHGISRGSGYSRRVLFELEIINKYIGKPILIYPDKVDLPVEISNLCIGKPAKIAKPLLLNINLMTKFLKKLSYEIGLPKVIYGENLVSTYLTIKFCKENNVPLIFDYHGAVPVEAKGSTNYLYGTMKNMIYSLVQRRTIKKSDSVITISNNFLKHLKLDYKSFILPMLPSDAFSNYGSKKSEESELRKELNIEEDKLIFCYLGQAQYWQLAKETIKLYRLIEKYNKKVHLLILTKDYVEFNNYIKEFDVKNATIRSVSHEFVPKYLRISDFGFVLRGPSLINKVASPTKVLEYLSMGVIPLMTEYVGDFSNILIQNNLGILIKYKELMSDEIKIEHILSFNVARQSFRKRSLKFVTDFRLKHTFLYVDTLRNYIK